MAEYIERDAVHDLVRSLTKYAWASPDNTGHRVTVDADDVNFGVDKIPSADVAPVRHGRWIGCNGEIVDWDENNPGCPRHSCFCSICKSWLTASDEFPVIAYFCPNCGTIMDLK